jgi:GNAT superfamily N-acetyltransferase
MQHEENSQQPVFSHAEPVLAVHDVVETITYWQDVLGFPTKWMWGNPPTHGAISWQKAHVQFSLNPQLATASKGNSVWIRVQHIKSLYSFHQQQNAEIVAPLENQPWGMAQYSLREINGYFLHFAAPISEREKSAPELSENIKIIARQPTIKEYKELISSVGWPATSNDDLIKEILRAAIFSVVAVDSQTNETIGCALILGDKASFYYVKDVAVRPDWQRKRVGTEMMHALNNWLERNAANNSLVALITGEALEPFYQQFGFVNAFSMIRNIKRKENNK